MNKKHECDDEHDESLSLSLYIFISLYIHRNILFHSGHTNSQPWEQRARSLNANSAQQVKLMLHCTLQCEGFMRELLQRFVCVMIVWKLAWSLRTGTFILAHRYYYDCTYQIDTVYIVVVLRVEMFARTRKESFRISHRART